VLIAATACATRGQTATQPATAFSEPVVMRVTAESLFLRCRADLNSTPVMRVEAGTLLLAEGMEYAHYRIVPPPEVFYFVAAEYVREVGDGRGIVTLSSGGLRVRAGSLVASLDPNTADAVARVENGAELTIVGRQEGWLKVRPPEGVYVYALDDYVTRATPAEAARFLGARPKATTRPTKQPASAPTKWRRQLDEIGQLIFREAGKSPESRDWAALERQLAPIAAQREDADAAAIAARWIELVRARASEKPVPEGGARPTTRPGP
jgi:hypothetical protein